MIRSSERARAHHSEKKNSMRTVIYEGIDSGRLVAGRHEEMQSQDCNLNRQNHTNMQAA